MVFYLGVGAKPLLRSAERSYSDSVLPHRLLTGSVEAIIEGFVWVGAYLERARYRLKYWKTTVAATAGTNGAILGSHLPNPRTAP